MEKNKYLDFNGLKTYDALIKKYTDGRVDIKQDNISDLDEIRTGASLGATALQTIPSEYVTEDEQKRVHLVPGGSERNDTIMNVIGQIEADFGTKEPHYIITQDGVRPFVSQRLIKEHVEAVIAYDGVYRPNLGNVYTYDGKAFEAVAVKSGVIENVYVDPLLGNTVILNCDNVLISYQGLASTAVKKGAEVKQGDVLGVAGNSEYYKECGVHVFVSAKMNNQYVDVESLLK